jgi:hypothetical protein
MCEPTPGTWHWDNYLDPDYDPPNCGSIYAELVSGQAVAIAKRPRYTNDRQWQTDACLIAAAPDMLEIVREVALLGAGKCTISKKLADMALDAFNKAVGHTKD